MSRESKMFELVEEYQRSGLSASAFARRSNVAPSTMGYWIRKKKSLEKGSGFVEISSERFSAAMEVELIFPNGVQLRMNGGDLSLIAKLVQLHV